MGSRQAAIQEEASRARVAATFLPLFGPLPREHRLRAAGRISYGTPGERLQMTIDDTDNDPAPDAAGEGASCVAPRWRIRT